MHWTTGSIGVLAIATAMATIPVWRGDTSIAESGSIAVLALLLGAAIGRANKLGWGPVVYVGLFLMVVPMVMVGRYVASTAMISYIFPHLAGLDIGINVMAGRRARGGGGEA